MNDLWTKLFIIVKSNEILKSIFTIMTMILCAVLIIVVFSAGLHLLEYIAYIFYVCVAGFMLYMLYVLYRIIKANIFKDGTVDHWFFQEEEKHD